MADHHERSVKWADSIEAGRVLVGIRPMNLRVKVKVHQKQPDRHSLHKSGRMCRTRCLVGPITIEDEGKGYYDSTIAHLLGYHRSVAAFLEKAAKFPGADSQSFAGRFDSGPVLPANCECRGSGRMPTQRSDAARLKNTH